MTGGLRQACLRHFDCRGERIAFYSVAALADACGVPLAGFPYSVRVLLENLIRHADRAEVGDALPRRIASDYAARVGVDAIPLWPARILSQDVSGIPSLIDLATMRDVLAERGGDPSRINPQIPVDLIVDHSIIVDHAGRPDALDLNVALEYRRNRERYLFLKWAQQAFHNLTIVPPGSGILHQINLEHLARGVFIDRSAPTPVAWPDTLAGTDSHTTMVNGIGVLGWGVGGIEAEAAMLGEPLMFPLPAVVGVRLVGRRPEGMTAADLVLTLTRRLREAKVVDAFVEFTGPALDGALTTEDRATLSNMAPEYGSTCAFFPVDAATLDYLRRTGRDEQAIALVEAYCRAQGLFREPGAAEPRFDRVVEIDLSGVVPSAAGPRRPHQQMPLSEVPASFDAATATAAAAAAAGNAAAPARGDGQALPDGAVIIAAITSCTHTSNPSAIIAAGLLARRARQKGLRPLPWVKTSFTPGSRVVADYLAASGLAEDLDALGFQIAGYGCASCGGGSGPLAEPVQRAIDAGGVRVAAVLSGNRNFEGRVHPSARFNYLVTPALVVAYALAGTVRIDLEHDPIGHDPDGRPVRLADLWPSDAELSELVARHLQPAYFRARYADLGRGDSHWQSLPTEGAERFAWDPASTYVRRPPFVDVPALPADYAILGARPLLVLGDGVTTDNISPADDIRAATPAGRYLIEQGVAERALHTHIARRGNHDVMVRATFTGGRLANELLPDGPPGCTIDATSGEVVSIHEASVRYARQRIPVVVVAGREYGTGSSRDWAAKGTRLLGVQAVLANGFERIHRSNLANLGILPLEFDGDDDRHTLAIGADSRIDILLPAALAPRCPIPAVVHGPNGARRFTLRCRLDTERELAIWRQGGILPFLLQTATTGRHA